MRRRSAAGETACILLDVQMTGLSGPQLQDRLANQGCKLPIVFLSGHGDIATTVQTIKAGAEDFLTKPVSKEKLLEAIDRALVRYREIQNHDEQISVFAAILANSRRVSGRSLTYGAGNPHKQIAYALGISERTVKLHRHAVIGKLRVCSLAELAVIAERLGLLPDRNGKMANGSGQIDNPDE